jgi:hypothetical protein
MKDSIMNKIYNILFDRVNMVKNWTRNEGGKHKL